MKDSDRLRLEHDGRAVGCQGNLTSEHGRTISPKGFDPVFFSHSRSDESLSKIILDACCLGCPTTELRIKFCSEPEMNWLALTQLNLAVDGSTPLLLASSSCEPCIQLPQYLASWVLELKNTMGRYANSIKGHLLRKL